MSFMKSRVVQVTFLLTFVALLGGAVLYMRQHQEPGAVASAAEALPRDGIVDFNYARDSAYINTVFADDENWYWLVDGDRAAFLPDEMMKTMSSTRSPLTKGNLIMKTLYVNGKPAGFLAYYMKNFYMGKIRFVFVDPANRGGGYGLQLVQYAVDDLKARGAKRIALVTRSTNEAAKRIYTKAGFELLKSPEGFAYFAKNIE